MNKVKRPLCRYYGGKWKMAPWIVSHFPKHNCYTEAFGGAGSVLLTKDPSRVEVYNDLSDEMYNLFTVLRDPAKSKELLRLLQLTPYSRTEWKNCIELSDNDVEQARRTLVLSTQSYNVSKSLLRKNSSFRMCSSGHHILPTDFQRSVENIEDIIQRLKNVLFENRHYLDVISNHDRKSTLHYLDPPYLPETRSCNSNFYQHEMSLEDHAEMLVHLQELNGMVIISGYQSELYHSILVETYGWISKSKKAISGAAIKGKTERQEIIWMNKAVQNQQKQITLL
jgi:DNA adenine methylase